MVEATDALDALMDMGRELSAAFQQSHNTEARGQFVRETPPGIIPPSMFESGGRTRSTRHGRSRNPTPPTQHYVDWDWTRDALPVVEKYKSILSEFAAREFGKEFRNACQKLRSKGLSAFVGFESFDATSHHELLVRLIGLSLEKIAQQNVDALSTFEQAPYPDQLSKLRTALVDEADAVREIRAQLPAPICPRCNRERDFDDLKLGREYCPDCWQLDEDQFAKSPSLVHTTWILKNLKQAEVEKDTNNVNWLKKMQAKFADTLLKIKVELRRLGRLELREDITIDYAENTLPEIVAELSMSQRPAGETLTIEQARALRLTDLLTYLVNAPDAKSGISARHLQDAPPQARGSDAPNIGLTVPPPNPESDGSTRSTGRGESGPRPMAKNTKNLGEISDGWAKSYHDDVADLTRLVLKGLSDSDPLASKVVLARTLAFRFITILREDPALAHEHPRHWMHDADRRLVNHLDELASELAKHGSDPCWQLSCKLQDLLGWVNHPNPPVSKQPKQKRTRSNSADVNRPAATLVLCGLIKHHKYDNGSCMNFEPIVLNHFAEEWKVGAGTVSRFLSKHFGGKRKYDVVCRTKRVAGVLKLLNGDIPGTALLGDSADQRSDTGRD